MSHPWQQTININEDLAKSLITSQTNLIINSFKKIGEGWDNIAYLINDEFIFRFPRREIGIDCMANELLILPYLSNNLSFPFSYPQYIGQSTKDFPAPFAGYKILNGIPLGDTNVTLIDDNDFAKKLALWLKELHSVSIINEHKNIIGDQTFSYYLTQRIDKTRERILHYQNYFTDAGFKIEDLLIVLKKIESFDHDEVAKNCYVHGDLYSKHLIVDEKKCLVGLIDWGDVHIGNPGVDLAVGYMIFTNNTLKKFFASYGSINDKTKQVALIRAFSHSIAFIPYCYETKVDILKGWAVIALKQIMQNLHD
jgi:aminoglycoside phosphotransferase (APT) family kinase protein